MRIHVFERKYAFESFACACMCERIPFLLLIMRIFTHRIHTYMYTITYYNTLVC